MSKALSRGDIAQALWQLLDERSRVDRVRDYIGASVIGTPCDRELFYVNERARAMPPGARAIRIFEFGNAIEDLVVRWLRDVGMYVYTVDPTTGDQFKAASLDKALQGHLDAVMCRASLEPDLFAPAIKPPVHFLEIKSANDKRWNEIVEAGVERTRFEHFAQLTTYLSNGRAIMRRCFCLDVDPIGGIYIAVNKNTSEIYLEEVDYNGDAAFYFEQRARRIQSATAPPPRLASRPDLLPCKYCDYKIHCFDDDRAVEVRERIGNADSARERAPSSLSE